MRNGGHAFPCYTGNGTAELGMTLRDYFAGQALAGFSVCHADNACIVIAKQAYKLADAMLAEREKNETVTNS